MRYGTAWGPFGSGFGRSKTARPESFEANPTSGAAAGSTTDGAASTRATPPASLDFRVIGW
jgi:hypothetical protein